MDVGRVIKGLECCISEKTCHSHCPYNGECEEGGYYYSKAIEDAIALLKAQQPRVMTLEELDDLRGRGQAVYYQDRDATVKSQDAFFVAVNCGVAWFKGETYMFCKTADGYDKVWRCWTSRPDEKVRAETPWKI